MSLRMRLVVGFGIVTLLFVGYGLYAKSSMATLADYTNKLFKHPYAVSTAMLRIDGNIVRIHREMKDIAMSQNDAALERSLGKIKELEGKVYKDFKIVDERFLGKKAMVNSLLQLFKDWKPIRDEVITLFRAGDREKAAAITRDKGAKHVAQMNKGISEFISFAEGKANEFFEKAQAERDGTLTLSYVIIIFALVLSIAVAAWIISNVMKLLGKDPAELGKVVQAVANGDFSLEQDSNARGVYAEVLKLVGILNSFLNDFEDITCTIEAAGVNEAKADESSVHGGFKDIAIATNAIIAQLGGFLNTMPVAMCGYDKQNQLVYANKAFIAMAQNNNASEAEFGRALYDAARQEGSNKSITELAFSQKTTQRCDGRVELSGKTTYFEAFSTPIIRRKGEPVAAAQLIMDQTQIKEAQQRIIEVAEQATTIADNVASSAEELAAQVEEIDKNSEEQRDRVAETATAMDQMNATVLEVARSASVATENSDEARKKADEGAGLVNQVVDTINHVNSAAQTLQTNMMELGAQADAIGGIMNVISDIADQTNLLALNAAIEAARAGEAGRGFAVVADEVRKLAEKTMAATSEVGSNIKAIQTAAASNMDSVNDAVESVGQATELSNNSGEALSSIVNLVTESSAQVSGIATAAEEQSATSEQITRSIGEVNRIVAETSDSMAQSSEAIRALSEMAADLNSTMNNLKA